MMTATPLPPGVETGPETETCAGGGTGAPEKPQTSPGGLAVLALIALGDWLLWDFVPGVSLVIFAAVVLVVAGVRGRGWAVFVVAAMPAVDYVQALSVGFLAAGMVLALGVSRGVTRPLAMALAFVWRMPRAWARLRPVRLPLRGQALGAFLRLWAFPLGGALVLLALLAEANPLIEQALSFDWNLDDLPQRVLFWLGLALMVVPFLGAPPDPVQPRLRLPGIGLNAGSVLRALVVFNLLLAVQMASDASVALAGLPPGMSHAAYAHRGAYPLLVTALLAGAFALAARPFLDQNRWLRPLLLLWLAQNIALTGSAALRLRLYVEAWGLSYLRVHAAIWMALVALGLALCLWQVLRGHGNGWMLRRAAGLGAVTLYACSFVNFAGVIAAENLHRPAPDFLYICQLGPMAAAAMAQAAAEGRLTAATYYDYYGERPCAAKPRIDHWQEWGFRPWFVAHKVAAYENPARR